MAVYHHFPSETALFAGVFDMFIHFFTSFQPHCESGPSGPLLEAEAIVGQCHHHEVAHQQTPLHACCACCSRPGAVRLVLLANVIPELNEMPLMRRRDAGRDSVFTYVLNKLNECVSCSS